MYKAQKFALGLLAAAAVATASDVVQLKKDTFDDFIKANDLVLAECRPPFDQSFPIACHTDEALKQSSLPGAVTARPSRPSTRRRQRH